MRQKWGEFGKMHPADEIKKRQLMAYITDMTTQKKVMSRKKVIRYFGQEKCTPRDNPGYAYALYAWVTGVDME